MKEIEFRLKNINFLFKKIEFNWDGLYVNAKGFELVYGIGMS